MIYKISVYAADGTFVFAETYSSNVARKIRSYATLLLGEHGRAEIWLVSRFAFQRAPELPLAVIWGDVSTRAISKRRRDRALATAVA